MWLLMDSTLFSCASAIFILNKLALSYATCYLFYSGSYVVIMMHLYFDIHLLYCVCQRVRSRDWHLSTETSIRCELGRYIFSTGNKDILEELMLLKISKKNLQRKSKLKVCKTKKRQNRTESVKNKPAGSKEFLGILLQLK